jgi:hypothetical protein
LEAHWVREVAEENSRGLSYVAADAEWQREVSEREHREQSEELTLLHNQGSELCLAIVGSPRVRNHLSEGMWITTLRHTEMARELVVLRAVVSSIVELTLGHSPDETFWVEEWCSRLRPTPRMTI